MATAINETEKLRTLFPLALGVRPRFHDRANFSFSVFRAHFFVAVRALLFFPHRSYHTNAGCLHGQHRTEDGTTALSDVIL